MAAVRVPPSACNTSQSRMICRSPSARRSTTARSERPIRRWISWVRPPGALTTSRAERVYRHPGSMLYSAVALAGAAQPRRRTVIDAGSAEHAGVAKLTSTEPFGVTGMVRSKLTGRIWSGWRELGRVWVMINGALKRPQSTRWDVECWFGRVVAGCRLSVVGGNPGRRWRCVLFEHQTGGRGGQGTQVAARSDPAPRLDPALAPSSQARYIHGLAHVW